MRYVYCAVLLLVLCVPLAMAKKEKGTTTLKDVQPAGTTDQKNQNQQFEFFLRCIRDELCLPHKPQDQGEGYRFCCGHKSDVPAG